MFSGSPTSSCLHWQDVLASPAKKTLHKGTNGQDKYKNEKKGKSKVQTGVEHGDEKLLLVTSLR